MGPVGQTPPASAGDRKYRDKSSPSSFYPLHPGFPRSLGQTIRGPSYGWPLLPSLEPNFRRGPKEGCSGERGSAEVVRGGGGAPSPGMGGKGSDAGSCREDGAGREERPPPGPPRSKSWSLSSGFESSRVHDASVPTGETESDPSPDRKEYGGRARGCSGSWGGPGGLGAWGPSAEPQGLRWPRTLPLATSGAGSRGAAAQRGGGRGDAKPLKGGTHFGHLGREEKEKGIEKRDKERRTGRARRRAGGGGAATRDQAGLRACPGRGW